MGNVLQIQIYRYDQAKMFINNKTHFKKMFLLILKNNFKIMYIKLSINLNGSLSIVQRQ